MNQSRQSCRVQQLLLRALPFPWQKLGLQSREPTESTNSPLESLESYCLVSVRALKTHFPHCIVQWHSTYLRERSLWGPFSNVTKMRTKDTWFPYKQIISTIHICPCVRYRICRIRYVLFKRLCRRSLVILTPTHFACTPWWKKQLGFETADSWLTSSTSSILNMVWPAQDLFWNSW